MLKPLCAAAVLLLASPLAHADALDTLRDSLRGLPGKSAVSGMVERKVDVSLTDKPREQGTAKFKVSAGADGLQISYPAALIARAEGERRDPNPDIGRGTVKTLSTLDVTELAAAFNGAGELLRDLEGATLKSEGTATLNGAQVKLIEASFPLRLPKADRERVKESTTILKLWLGADGVPVQAERRADLKGRVMLISFTMGDTSMRTYTRKGDRLIATRDERHIGSEGMGSTSKDERITTIQLD